MASSSPVHSSPGDHPDEDDSTVVPDSHDNPQDEADTGDAVGDPSSAQDPQNAKQGLPIQKRRRVTRACDECRRKKIKCDGKQPCTHCTVYSYECTYDQPSNRRRNPQPQYIEALEHRLQRAEALLRVVAPNLNLDDPSLDTTTPEQLMATLQLDRSNLPSPVKPSPGPTASANDNATESELLDTMMENSGTLNLDDEGHWEYRGHSSGLIFMQRLRKQFGNLAVPSLRSARPRAPLPVLESPKSQSDSPQESSLPPSHDLPAKETAKTLCRNSFDHACLLMRFVHEPSFFAMLDRIYDTPSEQYSNEEHTFLPLLYVAIAVGCLFSNDFESTLNTAGYEGAIGQGFQYFRAGRQLLDITDIRDLTSLQALCFMILFLQSSAKLSTCYSYVGIAVRSSLKLGLHRSVTANFNPIERELRKRVFWVVWKMDTYVSTLLGMPLVISDDDIDQEFPAVLDDPYITPAGTLPMPPDQICMMAGVNAHTALVRILAKVVRYIYPVKNAKHSPNTQHTYMVSHSRIREIERDLQAWMEALPSALRPGDEVPPEVERMRQLLRIGYAHVQMMVYRPFLHYLARGYQTQGIDKRSYACAAACVSVSRNIVHITTGMSKKGLLNGSYWFVMYTTYFAILSLVLFVLENPDSPSMKSSIFKDALEGKNTLVGLAKKSLAADRCAQSLNSVFQHLPEKLRSRQSTTPVPHSLKRSSPGDLDSTKSPINPSGSTLGTSQRAHTFPVPPSSSHSRVSSEVVSTPTSTEDSKHQSNRSNSWMPSASSATTSRDSPSGSFRGETISASPSTTQYNQQAQISPPFDTASNLPDLMPIMFPTGDPFAYPTQPLSTLEDSHFKTEPSSSTGFAMDTSGAESISQSPSTYNENVKSAQGYGNVPGAGGFQSALSNGNIPPLAQQFQPLGLQTNNPLLPGGSSQLPTADVMQSPDLVSLPSQNFMWQGFGATNPNMMSRQGGQDQSQRPMSSQTEQQFNGVGMNNFSPMGLAMDINVNFDDVFGNMNGTASGSGYPGSDDWSQWMT